MSFSTPELDKGYFQNHFNLESHYNLRDKYLWSTHGNTGSGQLGEGYYGLVYKK